MSDPSLVSFALPYYPEREQGKYINQSRVRIAPVITLRVQYGLKIQYRVRIAMVQ